MKRFGFLKTGEEMNTKEVLNTNKNLTTQTDRGNEILKQITQVQQQNHLFGMDSVSLKDSSI